jgi:hypothetical protein
VKDAAELHFFFQDGEMILFEEGEEFVGVSPFGFVVVVDDVGCGVGCGWRVLCDGNVSEESGSKESGCAEECEAKERGVV